MVIWMKYPEGNTGAVGEQVDFAYYPQMALKRVVGVGTVPYLDEAAYDEMGRMVTRKLGSLPETTYTYYPWTIDANAEGYQQGGRLKTAITGSLQNLAYTYDPNGNILSITDGRGGGDAPLTFGYDAADRLDWMNKGGQLQDNPDYDATTGNLIQKGQSNPQPANPAIALGYIDNSLSNLDNTKPHAVKSMGGNQYGYDANGNMIKRLIGGVTYTLTYNAENRLVGYAGGSITASFVYEGDGKRVKGTVNGVVTTYVGNHYEVQGTTTRKYYFAGTQRIAVNENGTLYHFLSDHLGSTAITVEDDGDFHGELRYSAWGETREEIGETPTTRRYTGQAQEELLGIYFFEARWLDPYLNRWLQPDSIIPDPTNPIDFDRYAYARNNPVRYTDSSGHCIDGLTTIACLIVIGGAILKAVDYGWTAYDAYQSGKVITNPNANRGDKMMAGLNVGLAALFEAAEPDDLLPVGLPLDDAARKAVMKGAKEAFEEGGEEGLEKFLRDSLGDNADEVLDGIGLGKAVKDPEGILQTGGHTMKKETLDALGLSKDEAHLAWNKFKDYFHLRNDFHGKIRADGAILDPKTNKIIGYLTDFVP